MNTALAIVAFILTVRGIEAIFAIMVFIAFLWCLNKVVRFK